jgi:hypothetical protein
MAKKWYVGRDGKKFGPFSGGRLKKLAASGRLRPQDTVWTEGMEKRVLAGKVKQLFPDA